MNGGLSCRKCRGSPGPEGLIKLWDGHEYCPVCVDAASPALADYAAEHPAFEDAIVHDRAAALKEVYWLSGLLGFGLLSVAAVLVAASGAGVAAVPFAAAFVVALLAIFFLAMYFQVLASPRKLPRVRIEGGTVEVFRASAGQGRFPIGRYALAEATWYLGNLREDSAASGRSGAIVPKVPAVIFRAPRSPIFPRTATGSTREIRDLLVAFLRLAGIPEGR